MSGGGLRLLLVVDGRGGFVVHASARTQGIRVEASGATPEAALSDALTAVRQAKGPARHRRAARIAGGGAR